MLMEEECLRHNRPISTPHGERKRNELIHRVLEGDLSRRATSLVIEWAALHQREPHQLESAQKQSAG
jgi:hypothetical protein